MKHVRRWNLELLSHGTSGVRPKGMDSRTKCKDDTSCYRIYKSCKIYIVLFVAPNFDWEVLCNEVSISEDDEEVDFELDFEPA